MTIMWFCIPAHGHTNPTLGLVKALTDAGHTIYYFSYEMFREKIEGVPSCIRLNFFSHVQKRFLTGIIS